jgi:hypothetical protein
MNIFSKIRTRTLLCSSIKLLHLCKISFLQFVTSCATSRTAASVTMQMPRQPSFWISSTRNWKHRECYIEIVDNFTALSVTRIQCIDCRMTETLEREPSRYLYGGTEENKLRTSVRVPDDLAEPRSYRTQLKNVAATQTRSGMQHAA